MWSNCIKTGSINPMTRIILLAFPFPAFIRILHWNFSWNSIRLQRHSQVWMSWAPSEFILPHFHVFFLISLIESSEEIMRFKRPLLCHSILPQVLRWLSVIFTLYSWMHNAFIIFFRCFLSDHSTKGIFFLNREHIFNIYNLLLIKWLWTLIASHWELQN